MWAGGGAPFGRDSPAPTVAHMPDASSGVSTEPRIPYARATDATNRDGGVKMIAKRLWLAGTVLAVAGAAWAGDFVDSWGPAVGTNAPVIEAEDQDGTVRDLASLSGERGVLLVLSRSADW